jgi:hypothetical protein
MLNLIFEHLILFTSLHYYSLKQKIVEQIEQIWGVSDQIDEQIEL